MNFVLRTAHAEEKKKGGHTNPDVRTIYTYIEIADVPSMWGSLRLPNYQCAIAKLIGGCLLANKYEDVIMHEYVTLLCMYE